MRRAFVPIQLLAFAPLAAAGCVRNVDVLEELADGSGGGDAGSGGACAELSGNRWRGYSGEPSDTPRSAYAIHWVPALQGIVVWGGAGASTGADNGVHLFDPATDTWTDLFANDGGTSGLQNRLSHVSFYVASLGAQGELWVFGGSANDQYGGRFDVATGQWLVVADTPEAFAAGVIAEFVAVTSDAGQKWCDTIDSGVVFGGGGGGNEDGTTIVIEPNPTGPEPYRMTRSVPEISPPPRWRNINHLACVDDQLYLYGGQLGGADPEGNPFTIALDDLWRLDLPTRTWTELASGGRGGPDLVVTHDPELDALVVQGRSDAPGTDVWIYDIASDAWCDRTQSATPGDGWPKNIMSHAGVYAPSVAAHVYHGGTFLPADGGEPTGFPGTTMRAYVAIDRDP